MERDHKCRYKQKSENNFNSHAHVERDSLLSSFLFHGYNFNSHAHVERDIGKLCLYLSPWDFNSHAHVERDDKINTDRYCYQNFNSHAHVERDAFHRNSTTAFKISTHTLTWSVTLDVVYIWCLLNVMRTYFFI